MKLTTIIQILYIATALIYLVLCFLFPSDAWFYIPTIFWILNSYIAQESLKIADQTIENYKKMLNL